MVAHDSRGLREGIRARSVAGPGARSESGSGELYLAVHGVTAAGESKEVGRASFELQIQK